MTGSDRFPTPRHGRPGSHTGRNVLICLLAAVVAGALIVVGAVVRLEQNVKTTPLDLSVPTDEATSSSPEENDDDEADAARDPLQILIIGSDTRTGNREYGSEAASGGNGQADVMILLHLAADRERAMAVSFPRDLVMPLPSCEDPATGKSSPAEDAGQLSGTLQVGPGCTAAALNEYTGLKIDHLMVADFKAVREITSAIGGVEVCVTQAVNDPKSGLVLPAGVSTIEGRQALAFLRTRAAFTDGSDTGRIRAQQGFLASMVRKVREDGTLRDLPRLYSIAETITRNLTIDEGLGRVPRLVALAERLRSIDLDKIEFITVPNQPWEPNPNRVRIDREPAQIIFDALLNDTPIPQPTPEGDPGEESGQQEPRQPSPGIDIEPSLVSVTVKNRSGEPGLGTQIRDSLAANGFSQAVQRAASAADLPVSQVFYSSGWEQAAAVVAAELDIPAHQVRYSARAVGVEVSIGEDFAEESGSGTPAGGVAEGLTGQTAEQTSCEPVR